MVIPDRRYERRQPSRDAKKIFIVCEGKKRESQYFRYFQEMDSRIDLRIPEIRQDDDNSPRGLLKKACELKTEDIDQVWIVFDRDPDLMDTRRPQIEEIRRVCSSRASWDAAVSNPCFEVWLFYHLFDHIPNTDRLEESETWRRELHEKEPGGFDSRRHPLLIENAIRNSVSLFRTNQQGEPDVGSTEVFKLAEQILPFAVETLASRKADLGIE